MTLYIVLKVFPASGEWQIQYTVKEKYSVIKGTLVTEAFGKLIKYWNNKNADLRLDHKRGALDRSMFTTESINFLIFLEMLCFYWNYFCGIIDNVAREFLGLTFLKKVNIYLHKVFCEAQKNSEIVLHRVFIGKLYSKIVVLTLMQPKIYGRVLRYLL